MSEEEYKDYKDGDKCPCGGNIVIEDYYWNHKKETIKCDKCNQLFDVRDKKEES